MHSTKQPSQSSNAVSRPSGTAAPTRVPVRRMPCLLRQPGCTTRAFIKLKRKRHYLGAYDDPAVQELYARLTRVWERTGHIDLSLIQEARHTTTDHRTTIADLGLKFRHYAEQRYVNPDGTLSTELHNFRTAWRIVREMFGSTSAEKFGPRKLREVQSAMAQKRKVNGGPRTAGCSVARASRDRARSDSATQSPAAQVPPAWGSSSGGSDSRALMGLSLTVSSTQSSSHSGLPTACSSRDIAVAAPRRA